MFGLAGLVPVLQRHFDRYFDRRGTIAAKEDMVQVAWTDFGQSQRQFRGRGASHSDVGHMSDFRELLSDCRIDPRMIVTV